MVSSWLSPNTVTTQDTTGIDAIKSLFRSLNLNRARLPGTLTFRDEPPGPDKSLCQIVSRFSTSVDTNSNAVKRNTLEYVPHSTTKNDSQESCNLNSRTESAIQGLITRTSNDEKDDVIYTGDCGRIFKHAGLNAESLETIRQWGSARTFTPNIGDINNDTYIGLNTSQKKVVSTCWPSTSVTSRPNNFNNEHWSNCLANRENTPNPRNSHNKQLLSSTQSFLEHPQEPLPQFSEYLDKTQTQMHSSQKNQEQIVNIRRKHTLKRAKRLLEKVSRDKLSIDLDATANGTKLKGGKVKNPYHRIHFSINNYFNSPRDSPLISPKRSSLNKEVIDSYGKNIKVIAKRKSLGKIIRGKQQNKRIISTAESERDNEINLEDQTLTESGSQEVEKQIEIGKFSDEPSSDIYHPIDNKKISKVTFELNSSKDSVLVTGISDKPSVTSNFLMDPQYYKRSKRDNTKKRLEAVLRGERRTVAKPSEILIPHSVRARHIFKAFANIPEQSETKVQPLKPMKKKPGFLVNDQSASVIKTSITPNSKCKSNGGKETSLAKCITYQDDQNPKQVMENYTNSSFKRSSKKQENELPIESNVPVVRSKTCIAAPRNAEIPRLNDDSQSLLKVYNESSRIIEEKKFENRHSRSLRMLKELLANTDNESITEECCEHSEEKINIVRPSTPISMNNMESQTIRKSEVTQSLQTLSELVEYSDVSTETGADLLLCQKAMKADASSDEFPSVSSDRSSQIFVDAQVSCSIPTIISFNEDHSHTTVKSYRMIETQTSRTSVQASYKDKRDTSVETVQLRVQSKYVNTEQHVLIDSSTGKDVLELQNFCCDTQLTNTESTMFNDHSIHDLKLRINGVETQMNSLKSLINIGIQNTSSDICAGLISSLSNQIISTGRLPLGRERHGNTPELPDDVIKAFEIAAEKAQNLHRAIEIYREHEMRKQNELKSLSEENQQETSIMNLLREEECKSQSLIVALKHISESEKALQEGLTKLVLHQEVQFTLETLIDRVVKEVKKSNMNLRKSIPDNIERSIHQIESEWICDLEKCSWESMPSTSRTKILPLVYGAVCTLIFWSLQYSTSCEFG